MTSFLPCGRIPRATKTVRFCAPTPVQNQYIIEISQRPLMVGCNRLVELTGNPAHCLRTDRLTQNRQKRPTYFSGGQTQDKGHQNHPLHMDDPPGKPPKNRYGTEGPGPGDAKLQIPQAPSVNADDKNRSGGPESMLPAFAAGSHLRHSPSGFPESPSGLGETRTGNPPPIRPKKNA